MSGTLSDVALPRHQEFHGGGHPVFPVRVEQPGTPDRILSVLQEQEGQLDGVLLTDKDP